MRSYSDDYYGNRYERTVYSANAILPLVLERIAPVNSVVDVGCGVGAWLSVLREKGVQEIQGLDGSWVDQEMLAIPRNCFQTIDLGKTPISVSRRYDLAISLEVAEHLPASRAKDFVDSLTALSDHVLFSAAIPFQGGRMHVNEQWQHYWVDLFAAKNYKVQDIVRTAVWSDERIPVWYRQNILLFSRAAVAGDAPPDSPGRRSSSMPLDVVHPEMYLGKANVRMTVKRSFRLFRRSLKDFVRNKLGYKD